MCANPRTGISSAPKPDDDGKRIFLRFSTESRDWKNHFHLQYSRDTLLSRHQRVRERQVSFIEMFDFIFIPRFDRFRFHLKLDAKTTLRICVHVLVDFPKQIAQVRVDQSFIQNSAQCGFVRNIPARSQKNQIQVHIPRQSATTMRILDIAQPLTK